MTECVDCIELTGGAGTTSVVGTTFNGYSGNALTVKDRAELKIHGESLFEADPVNLPEDAVSAENVALVQFYNSTIKNHRNILAADPNYGSNGIRLRQVAKCIMGRGLIENCDNGVFNAPQLNPGDNVFPSQFFMFECATIKDCQNGIHMYGSKKKGMVVMDGGKLINNLAGIKGANILLQLQPTAVDGCLGANNIFIKPGASANYFEVCYDNAPLVEPIPMKYNNWAYSNNGAIVDDTDPKAHFAIKKVGCSATVGANVTGLVSTARANCSPPPYPCWFAAGANPGGGFSESCTVPTENTIIEEQFRAAYAEFLGENYAAGDSLFQPLSNLFETQSMASYPQWCRQYVSISRHIVEPAVLGHGNGEKNQSGISRHSLVYIAPNPTSGVVEVGLNHGIESLVRITDPYGKLLFETVCSGNCFVETNDWPSGMYVVEILEDGAKRSKFGKLVVQKP